MENSVVGGTGEPFAEIAGYRVKSILGQGGMGTVYLAERAQGGLYALKVLSGRVTEDASAAVRFKREAQYAESLDHPHIPKLYDAGEAADGTLYFAMQYVPGNDLATLLARDGPMDLAEALSILAQVGDALDCAHAKGLIHRDVKPGNIIVTTDRSAGPYAYLTDFGLSKNPDKDSIALTKQGQFVGTTAYTAPEEILAQPRDHRVDTYSLGCVLFELLVGEPPFVRAHELDVMYAHVGDPRPHVSERRADLPPEIDAVIAKAMAISPADRYSSCAEFIAAASAMLPEGAVAEVMTPASPSTVVDEPRESEASSVRGAPGAEQTAAAPAAIRLIVRTGIATGRELLVEDELALGRETTLDGALADDHKISRRHAWVHRDPEDGFIVEDQRSANGTFVNGVRIESPHPLRPGDELRIGSTVCEVAPAEPEPAPSSEPPKRVAMRLELDLEAGELTVAIEHGPSARIVRGADGWRVESA